MTTSSIGDLSRGFALRNQTTRLRAEVDLRALEATTGTTGDLARRLGGDVARVVSIDNRLAQGHSYRSVTAEAAQRATAVQSALSRLSDEADELSSTLLTASSPGNDAAVTTAGLAAESRLQAVIGTLNTRLGDRGLFSGTETRRPALIDANDLLDLAEAAVASETSAEGIDSALTAWFEDPTGFSAQAYLGGPGLEPFVVASGEGVSLDVTALDPAITNQLKSMVMAALLPRDLLAGQTEERAELARMAGERLAEGATDRAGIAARVGIAEGRIAAAEARHAADDTAYSLARLELVAVDDYEAATALTEAEQQLETLYAITARLARLSLTEYL